MFLKSNEQMHKIEQKVTMSNINTVRYKITKMRKNSKSLF